MFKSHTGVRDAELLMEAQRDVGLTALLQRNGRNVEASASIDTPKLVEDDQVEKS